MGKDQRDLLDVLRAEVEFLEKGGYRHTSTFSLWPALVFEDSPTCINFNSPDRPRPCSECVLIDLVPPERQSAEFPCRQIPLNKSGETIENLYRWATQEETEAIVLKWLKATISKLESERSDKLSHATAAIKGAKTASGHS